MIASRAMGISAEASRDRRQEVKAMSSIFHTEDLTRSDGIQSHLFFGALYPLFIAAEGLSRLIARMAANDESGAQTLRPLLAQARANASIATSYVLMARTMLQSSSRKNRSERLS